MIYDTEIGMMITELESLILTRDQARKNKDFAAADAIRAQLEKKNVVLIDSPQRTRWRKRWR
jgi:cysteinyl-tRNA synthetase